jgi:hypothetical protein
MFKDPNGQFIISLLALLGELTLESGLIGGASEVFINMVLGLIGGIGSDTPMQECIAAGFLNGIFAVGSDLLAWWSTTEPGLGNWLFGDPTKGTGIFS